MKRTAPILALAAMLLLGAGAATAQSSYDWKTGNQHNVLPGPGGGATIYGNNSRNGTQWNTTVSPDGNQRGVDSSGNHWQYNKSTGNYYNYGTGKSCYGQGSARTCY